MAQIFISHVQHDHARRADQGVSRDRRVQRLDAGRRRRVRLARQVDQAIRTSAALLVIMSEAASVSPFVAYEWAVAWGAGLPVIPILLGPAPMHPRLDFMAPLDFSNPEQFPWPMLDKRLLAARQPAPAPAAASASPAAPEAVAEWVGVIGALLDQPIADQALRSRAVRALGKTADPAAQARLVAALGDEHEEVRQAAVEALVATGQPAVPHLVAVLSGASEVARQSAAEALGQLKHPAAVPALASVVRDPALEVRVAAVEALGAIGDPAAVPDLLGALGDEIEDIRARAAIALGAIRDAGAAPGLLAALRDPDGVVRWWAAEALAAIAPGCGRAGERVGRGGGERRRPAGRGPRAGEDRRSGGGGCPGGRSARRTPDDPRQRGGGAAAHPHGAGTLSAGADRAPGRAAGRRLAVKKRPPARGARRGGWGGTLRAHRYRQSTSIIRDFSRKYQMISR